jgi:hypothetical protein
MGFARNLRFQSIVMKNVSNPIVIDQYYCDQPTPCANQVNQFLMQPYANASSSLTSENFASVMHPDAGGGGK